MTNKLSLLSILSPVPVILTISLVYSQQKSKGRCDLRENFRAKLKKSCCFQRWLLFPRLLLQLNAELSLCMRAVTHNAHINWKTRSINIVQKVANRKALRKTETKIVKDVIQLSTNHRYVELQLSDPPLRDGPLQNLWGGVKYKKTIRAREN